MIQKFTALRRVFRTASPKDGVVDIDQCVAWPANCRHPKADSVDSILPLRIPPAPTSLPEPIKARGVESSGDYSTKEKYCAAIGCRPGVQTKSRTRNGGITITKYAAKNCDRFSKVSPRYMESELDGDWSTDYCSPAMMRRDLDHYMLPIVVPQRQKFFTSKPSLRDFRMRKTIGTGSFGRVFLCEVNRPGVPPMAVKRLAKRALIKEKQIEHVLSEKDILAHIDHPLLVHMYCTFQTRNFLYIVMEYVEGGEFFTYLRRSTRLDSQSARFYAAHIALIFEYLHPLHILYRDLKPENLLLTRQGYLKLTDFGFAKKVGGRTFTLCGTPEYIAPEVLLNKGHGQAVDWWALGILIYEMIVGYPPFYDENPVGIYQKIIAGKISFPKYFDSEAKNLVKKLLTHDLANRYGKISNGVSDVRRHPWFEGFDFKALMTGFLPAPYKPKVSVRTTTTNLISSQSPTDSSNFGSYDDHSLSSDGNDTSTQGTDDYSTTFDFFDDW